MRYALRPVISNLYYLLSSNAESLSAQRLIRQGIRVKSEISLFLLHAADM